MFKVYYNAWKVQELRMKILYTGLILFIARIGTRLPLPGISTQYLLVQQKMQGEGLLFQMLSGGAGSQLSIFSIGIGPYITSSIIMQLLTSAIPRLEQIQKEGEEGRKKISSYGRVLTVVLALMQGIATTFRFQQNGAFGAHGQSSLIFIASVLSLMAGTTIVMWLAEAITKNGVGNGSSMMIFSNIISGLPGAATFLFGLLFAAESGKFYAFGAVRLLGIVAIFLVLIAFAIFIQGGERRIPVQYSKKTVGRKQYGGQSSFIPIKVNTAGVISIIFAISLLQFPQTIGSFFPSALATGTFFSKMIVYLSLSHPVGAISYILLILFFTFFYTSMVMNPQEMAENMKKNGGFVPGIRPGAATSKYIKTILNRVTAVGGVSYALIAAIPIAIEVVFKLGSLGIGGTTILIVVGVALDTVKSLESQLLMRHYKSFLN